ncbi:hypothetical protein EDB81DRAFT_183017 [Dactylonectria macrodidyma]|uniref:SUZ domain-containing protein n=1 Tax=Dactylonectria macrodidyma TaxID=307937 RepID=A0A9P9JHL8_9HYPO|nr:hypothetical protein EDB81DRAFT_183017 [Dactylonectria macrodidyma]
MGKQTTVPDAWEDDWESQADKAADQNQGPPQQPELQAPLTKAERLAQHAEANRKIWESADAPQTFHYVDSNANVPLASAFKPQVKVLSRKPAIAKRDPVTGKLIDDEEEAAKKEVQLSPEEIRAKQKRDREEKQRRYEEARAKIFGESNPPSGASSPGTVTPPRSDGHFTPRGRGRGRGGYRNNNSNNNENRQSDNRQFDNRQFDAPRRPHNPSGSGRELYDPNFTPKPEPAQPKRANDGSNPSRADQNPIRAPRGPDGSGRGGFGFAQRGAKES